MRKLVSGFASSLDGYIEGTRGEVDWILIDKEIDFAEQMKRYDTFLYGRKSYESVLKMGGKIPPATKHYVFSKTLTSVADGFQLISSDIAKNVMALKMQPGKDIALFGGASLLAVLLDLQLVDEISIAIIPVLLGSGKPMVELLQNKVPLSLVNTRTYSNGTVQATYNTVIRPLLKHNQQAVT
jgi:dihydrofolate reductase